MIAEERPVRLFDRGWNFGPAPWRYEAVMGAGLFGSKVVARGMTRWGTLRLAARYVARSRPVAIVYPFDPPPHPWQEFNEHGDTCHRPGCRRSASEHEETE